MVIYWKEDPKNPFQVFSNLKNFCASYPQYNYNTLNNYLSRNKKAYENERIRIERKSIITDVRPSQPFLQIKRMERVVKKGLLKAIDQNKEDLRYWRTKSVVERAAAVTFIISQSLKPGQRMDKSFVQKRKLHAL